MTHADIAAAAHPSGAALLSRNPRLDLARFDFHDRVLVDALDWHGIDDRRTALRAARAAQRALRLHEDPGVAAALVKNGYDSAHRVAAYPEHVFVRLAAPQLPGGAEAARAVHREALSVKGRVAHLFANVKDAVASRYYNATMFASVDDGLAAYIRAVPGYSELFGSLDYLICDHCQSLLSPAAYFVDLMRVTAQYITEPNDKTIPDGFRLKERRPDIFELPLTCENTETVIPYLRLVDTILERRIAADLKTDPYPVLAAAHYPFNLPFQLPLAQIRAGLDAFGTTYADVLTAAIAPANPNGVSAALAARERLRISVEEAALDVTPDASAAGLSAAYGFDVTAHLPFAGAGKVTVTKDALTVAGDGSTKFTTQLRAGDLLTAGAQSRTVVTIVNDASLTVEAAWTETAGPSAYTVGPADGLNRVSTFLYRTRLVRDQLDALLTQGLSPAERAANVGNAFFINATGENLPPLSSSLDRADPGQPFEAIANLSYARLDRLSRFIRLCGKTGWTYASADYLMKALGQSEITDGLIASFGTLVALCAAWQTAPNVCGALIADLKAYGKLSDTDPVDDFDVIFNNKALLQGKNPYAPGSTTPFDWKNPVDWDVADRSGRNGEIRNRLVAALASADGDVTTVATWVRRRQGIADDKPLKLDLPTLSGLYRVAKLPKLLQLDVVSFLRLLELIWYPGAGYLAPPAGPLAWTLDELVRIQAAATDVALSGLSTAQLDYVVSGERSSGADPGYVPAQIAQLVTQLSTLAVPARVTPETVVFGEIDADRAASIVQRLQLLGIVNQNGIFDDVPLDRDAVAGMIFISPVSFVGPLIDVPSSKACFQPLLDHGYLVPLAGDLATVAPAFTAESDLSFLFAGDPGAEGKRAYVRGIMLTSQGYVTPRIDADQTSGTLQQALDTQRQLAAQGVADLLGTTPETVAALVPYASAATVWTNYVSALLTPSPSPPPAKLADWIGYVARGVMLATNLALTPAQLAFIVAEPQHFGIAGAALGLDGVFAIASFKRLTLAFGESGGGLTAYFAMRDGAACEKNAKIAALAALTGWPQAQICAALAYLRPDGTGLAYADTVLGVANLQAIFGAAGRINGDVQTLIALASACRIGITAPGAWATWTSLSATLLSLVAGRFAGPDLDAVLGTIGDALDTAKRDALLPYAVWEMNGRISSITDSSSLYQYLLIDVDMTSCATTSKIAQAISTVQLYMQRCRMSLEQGVSIDPALFPPVWWEWLSAYRVWEANRKIFLYPENYVTPTLRSTATNAFKDFSQALLQNELNDASVTDAYTGYMNEVSQLAALQHCASYGVRVTGADAADTYFLVARTNTAPFTYYYRTFENSALWSDWQKIDVKIGAPYVTPVYGFERLFLFWVEHDTNQSSTISDAKSTDLTSIKGAIRYSFLNVSDSWVAPQTLSEPIVIDFKVNLKPDDYINNYAGALVPLLNQHNLYWHQVEVIDVPPPGVALSTPFPTEMLLVNYGPGLQFRKGLLPFNPPDPPSDLTNRDEIELDWKACNALRNVDALAKAAPLTITGYSQYQPMISLDPRLVRNTFVDVQLDVIPGLEPAPYGPALNRLSGPIGVGSMGITYDSSLLRMNFYDDDMAANPIGYDTAPAFDLKLLGTVSAANSSVFTVKNQTGSFIFNNGDEAFLVISQEAGLKRVSDVLTVKLNNPPLPADRYYLRSNPYTATPAGLGTFPFAFIRLSTNCLSALSDRLFIGGVDLLLTVEAQRTPEVPFSRYTPAAGVVTPPSSDRLDFRGSFGLYFQEIFYFGPFLVADRLTADHKFSDAKRWFEFVFDPTAPPDYPGQPTKERVWRYLPFRTMGRDDLARILTDPMQIAYFNAHPFDPDAVASLRHTAYAKAIVMRYIDNLIDWGDSLFAQDTAEAINEATMLYLLAKDLLGPAPEVVGTVPPPPPKCFNDIAAEYPKGIPEFLIELENVNGTLLGAPAGPPVRDVPFNDIDSYFCIPENAEFVAYWARVEDRLFKIRHCMNLQGVVRPLTLFAPPIDPRQLIQAAASGTGISVSDAVAATIPFYRFDAMLERAKSFAGAVTQLGGALLGALERKDGDALEMLRVTQERTLLDMMTYVKEQQIAELAQVRTGLAESQASAQMRATFYTTLLNVGLSPTEILNIEATILAGIFSTTAGAMKTIAAVALLAPNVGSPFAMTYGGQQIGSSLDAASSAFEVLAGIQSLIATLSGTMAGYQRRAQDWQLQADIAGSDVKQIASQLDANATSAAIAQRDLAIHLRTIAQNDQTEQFLKRKFTNEQLYQWMADRLSTVYYQTYTLAFDLARAAQSAFRYETNSNQSFITFGYWDSRRKGLLAGETLLLSLAQMEKAYLDANARPLEIERTVSLLQLDPKALVDLKTSGECIFALDELLYDQDFPGQYNRKIKSISISIPAVVGPYQNVKATLTQLSNQVVLQPKVSTVKYLTGDLGAGAPMPPADELRSNWRSSQAIAISRGMDDSGTFELNFRDERYLPFEGTGAVSTWRLSMPQAANRFDYNAIADVVVNVKYGAWDGGSTFRRDVIAGVPRLKQYAGGQYYDLAQQSSDAWYAFMQQRPPIGPSALQTLTFAIPPSIVPPHVSNAKLVGLYFRLSVAGEADASSSKSYIAFTVAGTAGDPNATTLNLVIGKGNAATVTLGTPLDMKDVLAGNRTVSVNLDAAPAALKDKQGYLDAGKLRSFQIILSYTGTLNWT